MMPAFALVLDPKRSSPGSEQLHPMPAEPDVVQIYEQYFDFVWRSLRRLGVAAADLEDAAQDVFEVVHRRLEVFERRSTIKTWVFGIALRVTPRGQSKRAIGGECLHGTKRHASGRDGAYAEEEIAPIERGVGTTGATRTSAG